MNSKFPRGGSYESPMIPPPVVPPFAREIGRIAQITGLPQATLEVFGDANIRFETEGDILPEQSTVIASNHQHAIEPWLVQCLMGISGRDTSYVVGMPSSLHCQLIHHISDSQESPIVPVIPGAFAAEEKHIFPTTTIALRRLVFPSLVRPRQELNDINTLALERASSLVEAGKTVTIFPTGTLADAAKATWRRGLGTIVQNLSPEMHDSASIVVLQPERFSKYRVMSALLLRHMGIRPRPQTIVLRSTNIGTPNKLFGDDCYAKDTNTAQHISDTVREHYIEQMLS